MPGWQAGKQQTTRTKTFPAKKHPGWSAVTAEERGIARPVSHYAPNVRQTAEISDSHAFPTLSHKQTGASQHAAAQAADRSPWHSSDRSHARDQSGQTEGSSHAWRLDGSQSATSKEAPRNSLPTLGDTSSTELLRAAGTYGADTIQSLRVLHPWADTALLQVYPVNDRKAIVKPPA